MTTTRLSTLRVRLEEKRQQIAAAKRGTRGRVLFQTMRWLFNHGVPKNSSIYDARRRRPLRGGRGRLAAACWGHAGQLRTLLAKAANDELQLAV